MAKAKRRSSTSGDETKAKIVEATLATLRSEGIVGTSARAIAREGDFNQALIFYHFGTVDDAIVAAVAQMSERRMERHRERLAAATSLVEVVRIARSLHHDDTTSHSVTVLTQAFAGAAGDGEMGPKLYALLEPWSEMVAEAIERVLGTSMVTALVPHDQISRAMSALFLGIELLDDLDPAHAGAEDLFSTFESLAVLLDTMTDSSLADSPLLAMFGMGNTEPNP